MEEVVMTEPDTINDESWKTGALVYIDSGADPMVTLGPEARSVQVRGDVVTVRHAWLDIRAIMHKNASCGGINISSNKPFFVRLRPAVLAAAKRQGILVCKGPALTRKRKW